MLKHVKTICSCFSVRKVCCESVFFSRPSCSIRFHFCMLLVLVGFCDPQLKRSWTYSAFEGFKAVKVGLSAGIKLEHNVCSFLTWSENRNLRTNKNWSCLTKFPETLRHAWKKRTFRSGLSTEWTFRTKKHGKNGKVHLIHWFRFFYCVYSANLVRNDFFPHSGNLVWYESSIFALHSWRRITVPNFTNLGKILSS